MKKSHLDIDGTNYTLVSNTSAVVIEPGKHSINIYTELADGHVIHTWSQIYTTEPGKIVLLLTHRN